MFVAKPGLLRIAVLVAVASLEGTFADQRHGGGTVVRNLRSRPLESSEVPAPQPAGSAVDADDGDDWGAHFYVDGTPRPEGDRGGQSAPSGKHHPSHTDHGDGLYSYTTVATMNGTMPFDEAADFQGRRQLSSSYSTQQVREYTWHE